MASTNSKIKVLEVIYGFGYGGIRAFIMNYLQFINKDKFDVDIYVFGFESSPFTEQVHALGFNIFFEPENNAGRNIPKFISQLKRFMIQHGPYDVVHAHNNLISAWVLLAAKLAKVPVRLSHSHATDHFKGSLLQKLYSYSRRLIIEVLATNKIACGQLAGEAMYGRKSKFEIVANGIDINRFLKSSETDVRDFKSKYNIPENARVYANVTRLDIGKNHLFALEVFKEIHKRDPEAIFLYGGVVPKIASTYDEVQERIKSYGLEQFCRFTGPVMDVNQLYHSTDVWIYCSAFEGLPFGPLELQAAGIPVIASDVITREIDFGLGLVEFMSLEESPKVWADRAMSLQRKDISPDDIYKAFRKHNFDIRQSVSKLEAIYEGNI